MAVNIEQIITDSQTYAADVYDEAVSLLGNAVTAASGYARILQPTGIDFSVTPKQAITADPLADFTDSYKAPVNTAELGDFEALYVPQIPDDWGTKPDVLDTSGLFNQDVPVFDVAAFNKDAPEVDFNLTIPDAPVINNLDAPVLEKITIGDAPTPTIPTFDQDFLLGDPKELTGVVERYEAEYAEMLPQMKTYIDDSVDEWVNKFSPDYHTGLAQLEDKIASGMPGGQALTDDVEQSIYDRARARVEAERTAEEKKLTETMARRGYDLPPGAVVGGLQEIAANASKNIAAAAAETAIERAKMEIQHVQFVMQQANYLRQFMQNLGMQRAQQVGNVNGQAMQYAGKVADLMIETFNANLRRYDAALTYYRTAAQVYEVRIKSSLAELEAYKIEAEGKKLQGDLQKLQVDIFETEIKAEQAKIQLFLGEMQAVTTQAELERTKVQIFGEQVNAYLGQVKAKSAEFEAYQAAIKGDEAKVNAYVQQVNAYRAEVEATKAQLGGEIAQSEAIASYNKNITDQFRAELLGYTSEIDAEKTRFAASAQAYATGLEAYKTELSAELDVLRSKIAEDELNLKAATVNFEGVLKKNIANADLFMKHVEILSSTTNESSSIAANIAAAALDSQNTMVQAVL